MRLTLKLAGIAMALSLGACGGSNENSGGLTREEERQLDNAAAMLEDNVFDASADSLVANEADFGDELVNDATENESLNAQ